MHRSRDPRINLLFQFVPEKLGRFETKGWNFLVFLKHAIFSNSPQSQVRPISGVYDLCIGSSEITVESSFKDFTVLVGFQAYVPWLKAEKGLKRVHLY